MSAAATKQYTPVIAAATPKTANQKRLAAQNYRGFWVEANSKRSINGLRITRYLLTVMPSGYVKCPCEASKWSHKDCCHKTALRTWLVLSRDPIVVDAKPVPQATFACSRSKATAMPASATAPERKESLVAGTPAYMWKSEDHNGDYIPSDHYQHAYR